MTRAVFVCSACFLAFMCNDVHDCYYESWEYQLLNLGTLAQYHRLMVKENTLVVAIYSPAVDYNDAISKVTVNIALSEQKSCDGASLLNMVLTVIRQCALVNFEICSRIVYSISTSLEELITSAKISPQLQFIMNLWCQHKAFLLIQTTESIFITEM